MPRRGSAGESRPSGQTLKLARLNDARSTGRVLVRERALANVGDDLCIVMPGELDAPTGPRWEAVLVEDLQVSEAGSEWVRSVLRPEREPGVLVAMPDMAALLVPSQSHHRPALRSRWPVSDEEYLVPPSGLSTSPELTQTRRPTASSRAAGPPAPRRFFSSPCASRPTDGAVPRLPGRRHVSHKFEETERLEAQFPEGLACALSAAMARISVRIAPEVALIATERGGVAAARST